MPRTLIRNLLVAGLVAIAALSVAVVADEGMWTFDNIPRSAIAKKYNVQITDAWLQQLQRSVVRLESGCSGSFVSPEGLVLTNHHCAQSCLAENSTAPATWSQTDSWPRTDPTKSAARVSSSPSWSAPRTSPHRSRARWPESRRPMSRARATKS